LPIALTYPEKPRNRGLFSPEREGFANLGYLTPAELARRWREENGPRVMSG